MLLHTQFTSRDRVPGLEGCYLIGGTFPIGNLIPGPRNLVFADRFFFPYWSHWGFLFLLGFPHLKIKIKVSGDSKAKPFPLGDGFSKTRKSIHIFFSHFFLSFESESRQPVDRVMVHKLATPLGIEPRISSFIRGSSLNLSCVYWSTWFIDQ